MPKRRLALSRGYGLLEPGPVRRMTTAHRGEVDECVSSPACHVVDTRMERRDGLFVLDVVRDRADPSVTDPRTLHHRGWCRFMGAGETIELPSAMRWAGAGGVSPRGAGARRCPVPRTGRRVP